MIEPQMPRDNRLPGTRVAPRMLALAALAVFSAFTTLTSTTAQAQNIAAGQTLYADNCSGCHGSAPNIDSNARAATNVNTLNSAIANNRGGMSVVNFLSSQQRNNISAYIASVVNNPPPVQTTQTISFPIINSFVWNGPGVTLVATASSGLAVTFSVSSGPCQVSGSLLTAFGAGICNVTATQAGNASFLPASAGRTVTTNPAQQTITFPTVSNVVVGGAGVGLSATASSGLPVSYSLAPGVCTLVGSQLRASAAGACSVTANQGGNANYNPASSVSLVISATASAAVPLSKRGGVDIDGSGRAQMIVRGASNTTLVGRLNSQSGQFAFTPGNDPGAGFRYLGLVDFDGEGRSDLAFQNMTQGDRGDVLMWRGMSPNAQSLIRPVRTVWDVQAVGDLDGDGVGDLVWRYMADDPRDTGVSYIWFIRADGAEPQVRKRGGAPLNWQLLGAADLNGDGAADMVYVSPTNDIRVLAANALRTCANYAAGVVPAGYQALRLADFLRNGRAQILAFNSATNELRLLDLDGTGIALPPPPSQQAADDPNANCTPTTVPYVNRLSILQVAPAGATLYAVDDFDGDGFFDIVWRQPDRTLVFWKMNGSPSPVTTPNAGTAP